MWAALDCFLLLAPSARLVITCRSVNNDLLMSIASLAARPVFPVWDYRSLPARSTSYNLDTTTFSTLELSVISSVSVNIACDLEEAWFKLCEATTLFLIPLWNSDMACSASLHRKTNKFSTVNWSVLDHLIFNPCCCFLSALSVVLFKRSNTFSL